MLPKRFQRAGKLEKWCFWISPQLPNAEVDLGSSNSFLSLGLAAGGFGQALQRNQPVKDVCVRSDLASSCARGPAGQQGLRVPAGNDTCGHAPACLVIYQDRQPTSAAAAGHPDRRGSQETPGAREFLPWLPALSSGPRNPATPVRSVAGAHASLSSLRPRGALKRRRTLVGAGRRRGDRAGGGRAVGPGRKCCRLPTSGGSQHAAPGRNPG